MTLKQLRTLVLQTLKQHQIESPEVESGLLISHALGLRRSDLIGTDFEIEEAAEKRIIADLNRRIAGEPIQYIMGVCSFMSLDFEVNPATLIPRPDTEVLVEAVLERLPAGDANILDIGCGSGCIGLSIAHYHTGARITEVDISAAALDMAKKNAISLKADDRITFIEHDILRGFPALPDAPDCIVSNPPYIPHADIDGLQTEVRDHEPKGALDGGEDGLDFYRFITQNAVLKPGGLLAFEVGIGQADDVAALMQSAGFTDIEVIKDLAGVERVVLGFK